jgi:muramoyltetrapeptide carboxypeptidase LdcA involved in peptidoglycan recycling
MEINNDGSSSIKSRIEDIHDAFSNPNVKAIFSVIGGVNSNQLLRYLDFGIIKNNPKILCGYSDITVLSNAIFAKTGLISYSGPHFSSFGMLKGAEYMIDYFKKALFGESDVDIEPSQKWSDDLWFMNQKNRKFVANDGVLVINNGEATGKIIGGSLCTLNLLLGTEYMPDIRESILFIEDDETQNAGYFNRNFQALIHQPNFNKVRGVVIGRFQIKSNIDDSKIREIVTSKKELARIPVVTNVNFGHVMPIITFPVGGKCSIKARNNGELFMKLFN